MNTEDPNHPVQLAAKALRALSPEDQAQANDIARDVPTKPDFYFARADGVVAIAFVDEPAGVGSRPLRAWFADGKSRDLRDDSIERWGPRIPRWDPDQPEDCTLTWLTSVNAHAASKWHSLCERLDADPASAVSEVVPGGVTSKWNSLCASVDRAGDWQALCDALGMSPECNAEDLTKAALELRKTIGAAQESFKRSLAMTKYRKAIERIAELEANVNAAKRAAALTKAPLVPCCAGFWWWCGKPRSVKLKRGGSSSADSLVTIEHGFGIEDSPQWEGPCIAPGEAWGEGVWAARMEEAARYT